MIDSGKPPKPEDGTPALPIADEVRLLIAAVRQFIAAELAYQSARARLMAKAAAWIAGGGLVALTLLFFATMALILGLLLALAPLLGAWGAMGVVVGVLVVAAAIGGLLAWRGVSRFLALLRDGKAPA